MAKARCLSGLDLNCVFLLVENHGAVLASSVVMEELLVFLVNHFVDIRCSLDKVYPQMTVALMNLQAAGIHLMA